MDLLPFLILFFSVFSELLFFNIIYFVGEGNGNPLSILVWKNPWTEEPGRLESTGLQRVGHD